MYSCSDNLHSKSNNIAEQNDSLTISNEGQKNKSDSLYKIMVGKLADTKTAGIAILWEPKATYIQYRSHEICKDIETAISNLKSDPNLNNADSIYQKLIFYKNRLLQVDPDFYQYFHTKTEIITFYFDSITQIKNVNLYLNFANESRQQQLFILNQTLNKILLSKTKLCFFVIRK